ncbi:MAG: PQQ-binding-like beta-propeller repeat protein, partial [Thermoplasmata archaeon]
MTRSSGGNPRDGIMGSRKWVATRIGAITLVLIFLLSAIGAAHSNTLSTANAPSPTPSATLVRPPAETPLSSAYDWPELHLDSNLTGYTSKSTLMTSDAANLGVVWATNIYGAAFDSAAVAYDATVGETLAYVTTETGNIEAVNVANGQIVWGQWLGSPIRSSPVVSDGAVWIATLNNAAVYKFNATTGAIECHAVAPRPMEGSPTVGSPPGGVPSVYIASLDSGTTDGPTMGINAANCSIEWKFDDFHGTAGGWAAVSYTVDKAGTPLVLFGTADPDSGVYALNAVTGKEVWRFQSYNPPPSRYDVGAGVTISPPGKNGFADGVAYVPSKYGFMYALDLSTGKEIWGTDFATLGDSHVEQGLSTAAVYGTNLVFGYGEGVFDLNATNGKLIWNYHDPDKVEAISSPAIAGIGGTAIVAVGDLAGYVEIVSLASGKQLYTYKTGGSVTSSPAIVDGNIIVPSSDGFLYSFAVGGGNDAALPTTKVTSPTQGSDLANPNGDLAVHGSATDSVGVGGVEIAVQSSGTGGPWWNGTSNAWTQGPADNLATVADPGATTSGWTFSFPIPQSGGSFIVTANGMSIAGQSDIKGAEVGFDVMYSTSGPHLRASPSYVAPGGTVTVNGGGFTPGEKVEIRLLGQVLATVTAATDMSIPETRVVIPTSSAFGATVLNATGKTSGKSATVPISIGNSWDQFGYAPEHVGFEPNDPILNSLEFLGPGNGEQLAWHYEVGEPIESSPAVVNGVTYVGDGAGNLLAIDDYNGGLLWNFSLGSGKAIDGSPAVDAGLGCVFFGANDGSLDAVNATTGTLVWSDAVGGDVDAPVFSNGVIYVTSSSGKVE